jgi:hypothetical protein
MATKQQAQRKAERLGCVLEIDGSLVTLYPPIGKRLGELHIIARESGWGETKADIYDELIDALDELRDCNPNCQC